MLDNISVRRARRLSLTPLIDVIFLLLLFFMLSSTFSRFSEVEVQGGAGGSGAGGRPDALLKLTGDSAVLNGEQIEFSGLPDAVLQLKEMGAKKMLIIVDDQAHTQELVALLHDAARSGLQVAVAKRGRND